MRLMTDLPKNVVFDLKPYAQEMLRGNELIIYYREEEEFGEIKGIIKHGIFSYVGFREDFPSAKASTEEEKMYWILQEKINEKIKDSYKIFEYIDGDEIDSLESLTEKINQCISRYQYPIRLYSVSNEYGEGIIIATDNAPIEAIQEYFEEKQQDKKNMIYYEIEEEHYEAGAHSLIYAAYPGQILAEAETYDRSYHVRILVAGEIEVQDHQEKKLYKDFIPERLFGILRSSKDPLDYGIEIIKSNYFEAILSQRKDDEYVDLEAFRFTKLPKTESALITLISDMIKKHAEN